MSDKPEPRRKTATTRRRRDEGFTLIELLVVLVILSLISGIAAPRVLDYLGDAKARASELQINALVGALDLFYLDMGRYPSEQEGLQALIEPRGIARWSGPYLQQQALPLDPWGRAYAYHVPSDGRFAIVSFGADGVEGGSDDTTSIPR
jgi:general secretion pathway protein G